MVWCGVVYSGFFFFCDPLFAFGLVDLPSSPSSPGEQLQLQMCLSLRTLEYLEDRLVHP